jgi:hypothetical protein
LQAALVSDPKSSNQFFRPLYGATLVVSLQQNLCGMDGLESSSVFYLHLAGGALRGDQLRLHGVNARE